MLLLLWGLLWACCDCSCVREVEWCGLDFDYSKYPSKEHQFDWLESYLSHYESSWKSREEDQKIKEISDLWLIVDSYQKLSHLYWSLWGKIMASSSPSNSFDYAAYSQKRAEKGD